MRMELELEKDHESIVVRSFKLWHYHESILVKSVKRRGYYWSK